MLLTLENTGVKSFFEKNIKKFKKSVDKFCGA